ncbi:MBL fold metallo-hydrolase [Membranicola marinus]|uniref:MBL fold metallo-hydrolase n=1 Tax=Membranihabitans marinus TaxID=1227546 RepID=A0A953HVI8_9BACT|nr:MBL fold metallo-hydrolase [Membranihabitans marinus]MBY5959240.1 MBL fold metallo-hydrolase [Membranihabitans marinus]
MIIEQIYDKALAHGSYAIESDGQVALVDPGRNPEPYLKFAEKHHGTIVAVFETHPHADFASSHIEFQKKFDAKIYVNPKVGVSYDYEPMEHEDTVQIGSMTMKALFTPGHSPDHNSYLAIDENGVKKAVFTGDSLFIGDVGRPDLREGAGNIQVSRKELAGMMFDTIHDVFAHLPDDVVVYPAHGAGSLCGKNISDERSSTIGIQKQENWAFQMDDKDRFMESFLEGQPFIPSYFPHSVEINRKGVPPMADSINKIPRLDSSAILEENTTIIDTRKEEIFKKSHLKGAINIQAGENDKFETWLGAMVKPGEPFYLVGKDEAAVTNAMERTAKIGYESYIKGALVASATDEKVSSETTPLDRFKENPEKFTIVDIRNKPEVQAEQFFPSAINIPLPELSERIHEIPTDQPVVVHCAGGYRSAIGSSLLDKKIGDQVKIYDLSDDIQSWK